MPWLRSRSSIPGCTVNKKLNAARDKRLNGPPEVTPFLPLFLKEVYICLSAYDEDYLYCKAIAFLNAEQTPDGIHRMCEYFECILRYWKLVVIGTSHNDEIATAILPPPSQIRGQRELSPSLVPRTMEIFPTNLDEWKAHFNYSGCDDGDTDDIMYYNYFAGAIRYYHQQFKVPISFKYVHFLAYKIIMDTMKIDNQPTMIDGDTDAECTVCFEPTKWKTSCSHCLCLTCKYRLEKCPMCRHCLNPNSAIYERIEFFCAHFIYLYE